ncbi:MAG: hypothetical protein M1818_005045 [Claussenomyces sp. TS43310]|nr:MAG: hypothetical protein M1818_005045 [Claussenomyces sp. TS43310]
MTRPAFKVIIVGGSVSGLTLAHCLHHAGIDYIILEKGSEIAFAGGASIGLQPHGLRILDQLGLLPDILATTKPIEEAIFRRTDGTIISKSHFARQIEERHGYPILFFERSELLEILYRHLPNKNTVLVNHQAVKIKTDNNGVTVTCQNAAVFHGDMVVGADGINSTVRRSLWDITRLRDPKAAERAAGYLFEGSSQIVQQENRTSIVISSTRNRVFWFIVLKHDKIYAYPNIPRYTTEQAKAIMEKACIGQHVTELTNLRDIWNKRSKFAMVSLEEVVFKQWHEERIVLVGDSVHKASLGHQVTPNAGHGGNTAIESAATLTNLLHDANLGIKGSLDYAGLREIFHTYQANRMERVDFASGASSATTRIQALDNPLWKTIATLLPILGEDFEVNSASNLIMRGEPLKFIKYKGKEGNVPWDGWTVDQTAHESKIPPGSRSIQKLVYLSIGASMLLLLSQSGFFDGGSVVSAISTAFNSSFNSSELRNYYLGKEASVAVAGAWLPTQVSSNSASSVWGSFAACMNLLPVGTIVALEAFRKSNRTLLSTRFWVAAIALQLGGFASLAPLCIFAYCVEANLSTRDQKGYVVPLKYANSIIIAVLVSATLPILLLLQIPGLVLPTVPSVNQRLFDRLVHIFPMIPYCFTLALAHTRYRTTRAISFGHEDVSYLQGALFLSAAMSAVSHIGQIAITVLFARSGDNVLSSISPLHLVLGSFGLERAAALQYFLLVMASMIWCFLATLKILVPQKTTAEACLKMAARMVVGTVMVGPGATMALLWIWREDKTRCMDSQWRHAARLEQESAQRPN